MQKTLRGILYHILLQEGYITSDPLTTLFSEMFSCNLVSTIVGIGNTRGTRAKRETFRLSTSSAGPLQWIHRLIPLVTPNCILRNLFLNDVTLECVTQGTTLVSPLEPLQ